VPARGGFLEIPPARIEEVTRTNYLGSVWCTLAFLDLLEAGRPADVVNVASIAGTVSVGPSGPYAASKHAQLAFSRSVTAELGPRGVRVHSVNPAFTETEGFPQEKLADGAWTRRLVMEPDRVARAIIRAVERDRAEVFVPNGYRAAAALQGLAPGSLTRLYARWTRSRR
jgi:short-subunit dehydrogenase